MVLSTPSIYTYLIRTQYSSTVNVKTNAMQRVGEDYLGQLVPDLVENNQRSEAWNDLLLRHFPFPSSSDFIPSFSSRRTKRVIIICTYIYKNLNVNSASTVQAPCKTTTTRHLTPICLSAAQAMSTCPQVALARHLWLELKPELWEGPKSSFMFAFSLLESLWLSQRTFLQRITKK